MENNKDLEEANEQIERSKVDLNSIKATKEEDKPDTKNEDAEEEQVQGSGIFTADGKELPQIDGGYDIIEPGGSMGDDDFVSI